MNILLTIRNARNLKRRIYLIGNGGSHANAAHICNDLLAIGVRAFTLDAATLTASANDFGYETVFARWIKTVGDEGDVLVALSGSGKSPNILAAISEAQAIGMQVIKVFGNELSLNMQQSEEYQLVWGHDLWRQLKS